MALGDVQTLDRLVAAENVGEGGGDDMRVTADDTEASRSAWGALIPPDAFVCSASSGADPGIMTIDEEDIDLDEVGVSTWTLEDSSASQFRS